MTLPSGREAVNESLKSKKYFRYKNQLEITGLPGTSYNRLWVLGNK